MSDHRQALRNAVAVTGGIVVMLAIMFAPAVLVHLRYGPAYGWSMLAAYVWAFASLFGCVAYAAERWL